MATKAVSDPKKLQDDFVTLWNWYIWTHCMCLKKLFFDT